MDSRKENPVGQSAPAKTNDERLKFISQFGWEVEDEPIEVSEILIPKDFDAVYTSYNGMQQMQGYDLSKFQNKRCKRYIYKVTNYPDEGGEVHLNLIVYKNKVVGGDVASVNLEGFMHGFDIASRTAVDLSDEGLNTSVVTPGVVQDGTTQVQDGATVITENDNVLPLNPGTGGMMEDIPTTVPGTVVQDPTTQTTPGTIVVPPGTSTPAEIVPPQTQTVPPQTVPPQTLAEDELVVPKPEVLNPGTGADVPPYNAVG